MIVVLKMNAQVISF